jgi:hypothetical protein
MKGPGTILIVALCLHPNTSKGADFGAEDPQAKDKYKGANKALAVMNMVGIGGENVKSAAYFVDDRLDGKEFRLHEGSYAGYTMKMQFNTEKIKTEGFEIKLTNESLPNWEVKGSSEEVMLNYKLEW